MSAESDRLLRERIGSKLDAFLSDEQLTVLFDEVLALKKRGWGEFNCKKCGQWQKHQVEIPDVAAVTKALLDLANQAFGTPGKAADPVDDGPVEEFTETDMASLDLETLRRLAAG